MASEHQAISQHQVEQEETTIDSSIGQIPNSNGRRQYFNCRNFRSDGRSFCSNCGKPDTGRKQ